MALWQTESKAKNLPVYLFEENVGKLVQDPKTNIVKPGSLDKGKLRVFRSRDDALIHLTWEATFTKNKTPQDSEDFIIFEGDCQAKLIPNKPGRVFFLKFQGNDSKKLFWFQSGDQSKDAEKIKTLNKALNETSELEEQIDPAGSRLAKSLPRHTGIRGLEEQIQQTDELLDRLLNEHGLQNAGVVPGFEHLDETRDEISQILEELKEIQGVGQVQISHDESEKEDEEEQSSGKGSCEDSEELVSEDNNSEVANSEDSINSEEETKETDEHKEYIRSIMDKYLNKENDS